MSLSQAVRNIPTYMRAGALAQEVLRRNPEHPGAAHYVIHAFDDPVHAPIGLYAAERYSEIAPSADHAQHMTTHIFLALGMWPEVVQQNVVASGPDSAKWRPGHYTSWMQYGLLQEARYADARRLIELTRANMPIAAPAREPLLPRAHAGAAGHRRRGVERPGPQVDHRYRRPRHRAAGHRGLHHRLRRVQAGPGRGGIIRGGPARSASTSAGKSDRFGRVETAVALEKELRGLVYIGAGRHDEGIALLREATTFEDGLAAEYGPPDIVKPTHELLGEVLLARGEHARGAEGVRPRPGDGPGTLALAAGSCPRRPRHGDTAVATNAEATLKKNWATGDAAALARYSQKGP